MSTSLQVYYYGQLTTYIQIITCLFISPDLFAFWRIGSGEYPMSLAQFGWYVSIGISCYGYFLFAPIALQNVKAGTFVPFTNIAIIMSFFFEILYFGRVMFYTDYLGASMIILGTTLQAKFAEWTQA